MALSISSTSSGFYTPMSEECLMILDWHQMLFHYLRLLRMDYRAVYKHHHVNIDKDTFKTPNIKAFQVVAHFLLTKLDRERAKKTFADVWPIYEKKQEAGFCKKVKEWCSEIQGNNKDFFPHINPSVFMQPSGEKFVQVLCYLASHILNKMPMFSKSTSPPIISSITNKPNFNQQFQLNFLKGTVAEKQKKWKNLQDNFGQEYLQRKQSASKLIELYRVLCQEQDKATLELTASVEQSCLTDSQKLALFDATENPRMCHELSTSIEKHQTEIRSMVDKILEFSRCFTDAKQVIASVLDMKKGRPTLDGKVLISQVPTAYVERYQNIHSGTSLELQLKNGCYNFLPVFNLMLFAVPVISEISKSLRFPPLNDELAHLSQLEGLIHSRSLVADQLHQRWTKNYDEQTAGIERLLRSRVPTSEVPMALQPFTPCRNLLPSDNKYGKEGTTPATLRAVLSLNTPADLGAKPRSLTSLNGNSRPSLDLLPMKRRDERRSNGRLFHERPEWQLNDRRRSQEAHIELCRKKSLTPDGVFHHGSANRTSFGGASRPNRTGTSSLAASPVLERVVMMSSGASIPAGSPLSLKQSERRSLPQQVPTSSRNTRSSVLNRAAEAIVFDLVRLDSPEPDSYTAALVDPNSSLEKRAFVSNNLVGRSPEDGKRNGHDSRSCSNLDLLRLLESKLAPSSQNSSLVHSRNCSPMPNNGLVESSDRLVQSFDCDFREKGLLDASSASLIDDILDLSLGP